MTGPYSIYEHELVDHLMEKYRRFETDEMVRKLQEIRKAMARENTKDTS